MLNMELDNTIKQINIKKRITYQSIEQKKIKKKQKCRKDRQ